MADRQDDRQRRRPPVRSRQPRQVHQGTDPQPVSPLLCGDVCNNFFFSLLSAVMTPLRNQRPITPCHLDTGQTSDKLYAGLTPQ